MESRTRTRRRPLYTCGKSALATANRAYAKAQESAILKGAYTKLLEKSIRGSRLIFCTIQYHCLAVLSATDSWILSTAASLERIFPPSVHVFDKVDEMVGISESFPERSEDFLTRIISWLEMLISAIGRWETRSANEKEIRVDTGHDFGPQSPEHTKGVAEGVGHTSGAQLTKTETVVEHAREEDLEKETKEEADDGNDDEISGDDQDQTGDSDKEKDEKTSKKKKNGGKSKRGKKKR